MRRFNQQQVTDHMPMRVVERLEVVQIENIRAPWQPLRLLAAIVWLKRSSSKRRFGSWVSAS